MRRHGSNSYKRAKFFKALARCGNVTQACRKAVISRDVAYDLKRTDELFAAAWQDAIERYVEMMEAEADRRGRHGVDKPVFYQGAICGEVREYSDTLLIFRLKALKPEKYRENLRLSGDPENPIRVIEIVRPGSE